MKKQFTVTLNEDGTVFAVEEVEGKFRRLLNESSYIGNEERAWMLREDNAEDDNAEYHSVRVMEFWN